MFWRVIAAFNGTFLDWTVQLEVRQISDDKVVYEDKYFADPHGAAEAKDRITKDLESLSLAEFQDEYGIGPVG